MPSYYRRYLSRGGAGSRRWRRTGWWRSYGRGRRASRSAYTSGRRRMTLRVPVEAQVQFSIAAGSNWSNLACVQPFMCYKDTSTHKSASVAALINSPLYRNYCYLYDQVKVDSVYVSGSIIDGIGIGGNFNSLSFSSSWDRNVQPFEVIIGGKPGITAQTIQYGSEAQSFLLTNNSRQLVRRWNKASDILERTTFHDCSFSTGSAQSEYKYWDEAFMPIVNGVFSSTNGGHGYVPGLWMAFYSPQTDVSPRTVNVTFKVIWKVTFRNPKYGLAAESAGAKAIEESGLKAEDVVVEEGEGEGGEDDELDPETIRKLKALLHEDVQLPLTVDDKKGRMDDEEEKDDEKGS